MFNKKDLKNGMVVEFNNGKRRMVWDDKLIDNIGFIWMNNIRENDLKHLDSIQDEYIVKVYKHKDIGSIRCFLRNDCLTQIWSIY